MRLTSLGPQMEVNQSWAQNEKSSGRVYRRSAVSSLYITLISGNAGWSTRFKFDLVEKTMLKVLYLKGLPKDVGTFCLLLWVVSSIYTGEMLLGAISGLSQPLYCYIIACLFSLVPKVVSILGGLGHWYVGWYTILTAGGADRYTLRCKFFRNLN